MEQAEIKCQADVMLLCSALHRKDAFSVISIDGSSRDVSIDNCTDAVLSEADAAKLFAIVQRGRLLFYPIGNEKGKSAIYAIARINDRLGQVEEMIRFRQRQLPAEYTFEYLSKMFNYNTQPDNKRPQHKFI